jgi:hypothetical protein
MIGQIFKEMGLVTEYDIQQALAKQKETGEAIGQILVGTGQVTEVDLSRALAEQAGLEFIDLEKVEIPPEVIELVDHATVDTFQIMPVEFDGSTLVVAVSRPDNLSVLDDLRFSLPEVSNFKAKVANEDQVKKAIEVYYQDGGSNMDELLAGVGKVHRTPGLTRNGTPG